jgi:hypothetical protein
MKNQSVLVHVKLSGPTWHFRFGSREAATAWIKRNSEMIAFAVIRKAK